MDGYLQRLREADRLDEDAKRQADAVRSGDHPVYEGRDAGLCDTGRISNSWNAETGWRDDWINQPLRNLHEGERIQERVIP